MDEINPVSCSMKLKKAFGALGFLWEMICLWIVKYGLMRE